MKVSSEYEDQAEDIIRMFRSAFAASEGEDEGAVIAGLVRDLLATTRKEDLFVYSAWVDETVVGGIVFSRLSYEQDNRTVFILSPVAVDPDRQGRGIGQALLKHGLGELQKRGVDVVMTYGDPKYYSKVGFRQITEDVAQAPLALQYPEGWLAQPLRADKLAPLIGPSQCVSALNQPHLW